MTTRYVQGLRWVRRLPGRPEQIPQGRPRGRKAAGLRYERALARQLPQARHGLWFEYEDYHGHGFCQTDFILPYVGTRVVLEMKYTWTPAGHLQLERLYLPVLRHLLQTDEVFGIVVCRRLLPAMSGVVVSQTLEGAIRLAWGGQRVVWHWLAQDVPQLQQRAAA